MVELLELAKIWRFLIIQALRLRRLALKAWQDSLLFEKKPRVNYVSLLQAHTPLWVTPERLSRGEGIPNELMRRTATAACR